MAAVTGTLRYLDAKRVRVSGQRAGDLKVQTADQRVLGLVEGILIEPATRRARYYMVRARGLFRNRRCLVTTDRVATLDLPKGIIYIDVDPADLVDQFDASAIPRFSDDDLIDTLFAPAA